MSDDWRDYLPDDSVDVGQHYVQHVSGSTTPYPDLHVGHASWPPPEDYKPQPPDDSPTYAELERENNANASEVLRLRGKLRLLLDMANQSQEPAGLRIGGERYFWHVPAEAIRDVIGDL